MSSRNQDGRKSKTKQIAAAVVGNALEWYDFVVYGFFTLIISRTFFPASSKYASLLLTTATFGVGFFMRPVGGVLIGIYADRKGRKAALQLIIILMTVSMAIMALAPPYAAIGIGAPLLMVLARLLQGLATGGEFASATAYLVESAPSHRRGFFGSLQMLGQTIAVLLGAIWGAVITQSLSPDAIDSFGFRLPFLFGLLIAPVGIYMRKHLDETDDFHKLQDKHRCQTLSSTIADHWRAMLVTGGITVSLTITFYVVLVYMPTFANQHMNIPLNEAFWAQVAGLVCMSICVLASGALSDYMNRARIIQIALGLFFCSLLPLFNWMLTDPNLTKLIVTQVILCSLAGAFYGPISTTVAEQFPVNVRSTGIAVGYNTAVMIFGGFASFAITWLINETGSSLAPAYYVMFGAAVGFCAALFATSGENNHSKNELVPANANQLPEPDGA